MLRNIAIHTSTQFSMLRLAFLSNGVTGACLWLVGNTTVCTYMYLQPKRLTQQFGQALSSRRKGQATTRGYLVERWVRGCAAQIGCFSASQVYQWPLFLFETWFRYRSRLCKMHNFQWIFPLVYLLVVKKYLCVRIYMVKTAAWFKKGPFKKQMV